MQRGHWEKKKLAQKSVSLVACNRGQSKHFLSCYRKFDVVIRSALKSGESREENWQRRRKAEGEAEAVLGEKAIARFSVCCHLS